MMLKTHLQILTATVMKVKMAAPMVTPLLLTTLLATRLTTMKLLLMLRVHAVLYPTLKTCSRASKARATSPRESAT